MMTVGMGIEQRALVIGLTGPFGSGCSTAAGILESMTPPFNKVRLSAVLRELWKATSDEEPTREQLQELGDGLRAESGLGALVERALAPLEDTKTSITRVVIDGIRNTGEIDYLSDRFGDKFFLLAIYAPDQERWDRVRNDYVRRGLDEQDFRADDKRDQDEETPHGQQVVLCVDRADVFISNSQHLASLQLQRALREKIAGYVALLSGAEPRYPTPDEVLMNMAFSASHATKCLKRRVGAVIVDENGEAISVGFNENPDKIQPCVFEFKECFRDRVRNDHFREKLAGKTVCPECGESIGTIVGPPWRCAKCKANLEEYFFPDRAMKWCTALHAEERAIINARGRNLKDAALYTTAFPCFLCAEKIIQAGIRSIIFAEPYPDILSAELLERASSPIEVQRFEGVRSGSFDRIFGPIQKIMEDKIDEERRETFGVTS